jgi:hypothetical protein
MPIPLTILSASAFVQSPLITADVLISDLRTGAVTTSPSIRRIESAMQASEPSSSLVASRHAYTEQDDFHPPVALYDDRK